MSRNTYRINNRQFDVWRGWYHQTRHSDPDIPYAIQLISLRLADALPADELHKVDTDALMVQPTERVQFKRERTQEILHAGHGSCALSNATLARAVLDTLEDQHGKRYRLIAWCILPNQIHVLIEPCCPLQRIVQDWKSVTTRWALQHNEELQLDFKGKSLWMKRYQDRFIADDKHLAEVICTLHDSPVAAGLCESAEQWRWSSAYRKHSR